MQETSAIAILNPDNKSSADTEKSKDAAASTSAKVFGSGLSDIPQTSSSAFMSSGFGALSSSATSPFGTVGASKPSVFGGGAPAAVSGFGALAGSKSPDSTTTATGAPATGFSFGSAASSGFGALGSKSMFGSALGNGFAGGSGPKLSSFAAPGKSDVAATKPTKAFGAPDSDEEDGSYEDGSEGADESDDEEGEKATSDDKKKSKAAKGTFNGATIQHYANLVVTAHIEDGEAGEATLLQIRAKLFALESKEAGWKERGVGTLKINVPMPCASFDENGIPIPGSFDISGLEEDGEEYSGPRVPRLIMRQENTHRVILNTIIFRAMEFRDKPSTSTAQILFTAFEGAKEPKPINMLLKVKLCN